MSGAARRLAETLARSGAVRIAFLGLAKNVGKTTALVAVLAELHRMGLRVAATSAGRDGEEIDAVTGEPKPRFRIREGQLVASAASTFESASFPAAAIATLPFETRFGPIELRRAHGEGEIELIGPSTASQMARTAEALEAAGAEHVLLDGAVGRRAFACARVADAVVLSAGMAAGASLASAVAAAAAAAELLRLGPPGPASAARDFLGAVTLRALRESAPALSPGQTVVAEDFASIFLTAAERRRLAEDGIALAVRRPARLLAMTANPTAPARPPIPADRFFDALRAAVAGVPLFDVVADLSSPAG